MVLVAQVLMQSPVVWAEALAEAEEVSADQAVLEVEGHPVLGVLSVGLDVAARSVAAVALLEREEPSLYQVVVAVLLLVLVGPEVTMVVTV